MQMLGAFWIQVARRSHRFFANSSQLQDASKAAMALEHSKKNKTQSKHIQAEKKGTNANHCRQSGVQFSMSHSREST